MNNLIHAVSIIINPTTILVTFIIFFALSIIIGVLLAVASKFLTVKEDERVAKVTEMLPGYNCGACVKAGCAGFAESLVSGESTKISTCRIAKPDKKQEIKNYLDSTPGPDGTVVNVEI